MVSFLCDVSSVSVSAVWYLSCVVSQLFDLDCVVFVGNARNFSQTAFTMLMAA